MALSGALERTQRQGSLAYSYQYTTPADIILGSGVVRLEVAGARHRIRSDFPCILSADGQNIAMLGLAPSPWFILERNVRFLEVRLAPNFGGGGQDEAEARHGVFVVESIGGDQGFTEYPEPWMLPAHCYEFSAGIPALGVGLQNVAQGVASWQVNTRLPTEFYITGLSYFRRLDSDLTPVSSEIAGLILSKTNVPVGDQENLLAATGSLAALCNASFPYTKLPLASLFAVYAAETPQLNWQFHRASNAAATTLVWHLTGTVRW